MKHYRYHLGWILFLLTMGTVHATACKQTYKDRSFKQAIIFSVAGQGGIRCNYSKHQINFHHSYQVYGSFVPISGPWQVSSETGLIYCSSNQATECQFAQRT